MLNELLPKRKPVQLRVIEELIVVLTYTNVNLSWQSAHYLGTLPKLVNLIDRLASRQVHSYTRFS